MLAHPPCHKRLTGPPRGRFFFGGPGSAEARLGYPRRRLSARRFSGHAPPVGQRGPRLSQNAQAIRHRLGSIAAGVQDSSRSRIRWRCACGSGMRTCSSGGEYKGNCIWNGVITSTVFFGAPRA